MTAIAPVNHGLDRSTGHSGRVPELGGLLAENPELQIEQDAYNINVTANYGAALSPVEVSERLSEHPGAGHPAHLYFHVPLCAYVCHFCNYVKQKIPSGIAGEATLDRWTRNLLAESQRQLSAAPWTADASIESVFFGGGTAALLAPRSLAMLLSHVDTHYATTEHCEKTLEGNPDNFTADYVNAVHALGFNRFSVGVQSFNDQVTSFTGRGHDARASIHAIEALQRTGCPFNVDLMFGLPHQTVESVRDDLQRLVDLGVPTITIYRLRNADREKMGIGNRAVWNAPNVRERLHATGMFPPLSLTYSMRQAAVETLYDAGYRPSPCGWWSRPGTYGIDNIPEVSRNKWQHYHSMLAFGPGAYGWLTGTGTVTQTHNIADIAAYAEHLHTSDALPFASGRLLVGHQAAASALGFGFKANQPIRRQRFLDEYHVDIAGDEPYASVFAELEARDLVRRDACGDFIPTLKGEALHEEIISVYFHHRIGSYAHPVCNR